MWYTCQLLFTIKSKNEVLYLPFDDILYIQADGNYCDIHLVDGGVINTLTRQRAEMSRMIAAQFPTEGGRRFALLGRSYLINTQYVMRIQPSRQLLTFSVNRFGTCKKVTIKATAKALDTLVNKMEDGSQTSN